MSKIFRVILLFLMILSNLSFGMNTAAADTKTGGRSGDQYVTDWNITTKDNVVVTDNILEASRTYKFELFWVVLDNTFKKGDKLQFSIPDGFKIRITANFKVLSPDGQEVGYAKVVGDDSGGYFIEFEFTTDYVETHSVFREDLKLHSS